MKPKLPRMTAETLAAAATYIAALVAFVAVWLDVFVWRP